MTEQEITEAEVVETDEQKFERRSPGLPVPVESGEPNALVMVALQKGYDPEFIEKMMTLSERNDSNEAKKAFVKAFAEFKKNAPIVHKDKENKHFKSYYASKGAIVNTVAPMLAQYGLTHRWSISQPEGQVEVTCILTHELGHSESSTMQGPPDQSGGGSKNPIQQIKSTRTYLQVATFEDVTGTASSDDSDDDGNAAGKDPEYLSKDQQKLITKRLKKIYGDDPSMFFEWIGAETVDTLLVEDLGKITKGLNGAEKAKAEAEKKAEREPGEEG